MPNRNTIAARLQTTGIAVLLAMLLGCVAGLPEPAAEIQGAGDAVDTKIRADAYLFDVKMYREGKPTSVRLELFKTDSAIGLGGRAYLGKGALKGMLTQDSLVMYFPSSREFVRESVDTLSGGENCPLPLSDLNVLSLFSALPDSLPISKNLTILTDYDNQNRPSFTVSESECDWRLKLEYDRKSDHWRIRQFEFTNGENLRIKANRREYKSNTRVKANKFQVQIPPEAIRIKP